MKKIEDDFVEMILSAQGDSKDPYYGVRRISASAIGHECDANVALSMRSFPESHVSDQSARRFTLGHRIEEIVGQDLKRGGLPFVDRDPRTGKQYLLEGFERHLKAYADGYMMWEDSPPEPVEIKSMNAKRFNALTDNLMDTEPKYFDQMMTVMALSKTESGLFIAYNKDNSLYRVIRVRFDPSRWGYLAAKIERILDGEARKISKDGSSWLCNMCGRKKACQDGEAPPAKDLSCHHCAHASPDVNGTWWCSKHEMFASSVCPSFELFRPLD